MDVSGWICTHHFSNGIRRPSRIPRVTSNFPTQLQTIFDSGGSTAPTRGSHGHLQFPPWTPAALTGDSAAGLSTARGGKLPITSAKAMPPPPGPPFQWEPTGVLGRVPGSNRGTSPTPGQGCRADGFCSTLSWSDLSDHMCFLLSPRTLIDPLRPLLLSSPCMAGAVKLWDDSVLRMQTA